MTIARFTGWYWLVASAAVLAACAGEKSEENLGIGQRAEQLQALAGPEMYFVAHPDDDLLFINPEIENAIQRGRSVRTVYLTSGDGGQGAAYWQSREEGMRAAYAAMAGVASSWSCAFQSYAGKNVNQCTLTPKPTVSLAFMRLRDGQVPQLWATKSNTAPFFVTVKASETTVDTPAQTYTHADVINTIRAAITAFAPTKIGTLDSTLAYGPDEHTDHTASGLFVLEAAHGYGSTYELKIYRGYSEFQTWDANVANEARNLSQADHDEKVRIFMAYGAVAGDTVNPGDLYDEWIWRRYVITRASGGTGPVAQGSKCLDVSGGTATNNASVIAAACAGKASQSWTVQGNGQITGLGGLCLSVGSNGTAVQIATCAAGSTSQSWSLMSNGQLRGLNGACMTLGSNGSAVTAALCDGDLSTHLGVPLASQRWVQPFSAPAAWSVGTNFSDTELPAATNYASFQLADIDGDGRADACARRSDGLVCALNTGAGFAAEALVSASFADAAGWQADAYGTTLQFGDLDGDGRADVCGRKSDGVYCAVWNGSALGSLTRWSTDYSDAAGFGMNATTYGSLRLADVNGDGRADVCGRAAAGLYCALNAGSSFGAAALWSTAFSDAAGWSNAATAILMADLDGDGRADVCGRAASGISCALAPSSGTGFGPLRPWSSRTDFSNAAGFGASAATYGSIRLADVTGDGYADVCGRGASGVVCAISNGLSFDVAAPLGGTSFSDALGWSSVVRGSSLRFADLNGDGRLDVCGRAATGVVCGLAPSGTVTVVVPPDGGTSGGGSADAAGDTKGSSDAVGTGDGGATADAVGSIDAVGSVDAGANSDAKEAGGSDAAGDAGLDARATDTGTSADAALEASVGVDAGGTDAGGGIDAGNDSGGGSAEAGSSGAHLYVVAHPDDNLLFMNPDIENAMLAGHSIRTLYVTSGDDGQPASYWQSREDGIRAANAAMAGVANVWTCGAKTYAGKTGTLCTLTAKPAVTTLFLRLRDGSLPSLWATDNGPPFWVTPIASETTVDGANSYTRAQLVSVLSAIITEVAPQRVGTLDGTLANGDDHTDHVTSAMFMLEAVHAQGGVSELRSYRGYSMFQNWFDVPTPMARNLSTAEHAEKIRLMTAYGSTPATGDLYDEWCWRQYYTTSVLGGPRPLTGQGNRCVSVAGSAVTAAACSSAASQSFTLQANGDITGAGSVCLAVGADGTSLAAGSCSGAAKQKWTLLDNGQLRGAGATCITLGGDNTTLSAAICDSQQVGTQLTVLATQHWSH